MHTTQAYQLSPAESQDYKPAIAYVSARPSTAIRNSASWMATFRFLAVAADRERACMFHCASQVGVPADASSSRRFSTSTAVAAPCTSRPAPSVVSDQVACVTAPTVRPRKFLPCACMKTPSASSRIGTTRVNVEVRGQGRAGRTWDRAPGVDPICSSSSGVTSAWMPVQLNRSQNSSACLWARQQSM